MKYNNSPGSLDGPPKKEPSLPAKIIGGALLAIPVAFVLVGMAFCTVWMIVNFPV